MIDDDGLGLNRGSCGALNGMDFEAHHIHPVPYELPDAEGVERRRSGARVELGLDPTHPEVR